MGEEKLEGREGGGDERESVAKQIPVAIFNSDIKQ